MVLEGLLIKYEENDLNLIRKSKKQVIELNSMRDKNNFLIALTDQKGTYPASLHRVVSSREGIR